MQTDFLFRPSQHQPNVHPNDAMLRSVEIGDKETIDPETTETEDRYRNRRYSKM